MYLSHISRLLDLEIHMEVSTKHSKECSLYEPILFPMDTVYQIPWNRTWSHPQAPREARSAPALGSERAEPCLR